MVRGDGHFLGHPQTFARMQSDFLYPQVADRRPPQEWEAAGGEDIRAVAKQRAREILGSHVPDHVAGEVDRELRKNFDIYLR